MEVPEVPGEQNAEVDFSGAIAVIQAEEFDAEGKLWIKFSEETLKDFKNSRKELHIEMPDIDLTLAANNLQQLAKVAGAGYNLHLTLDDAAMVDDRPALAQQLNIAATDSFGRKLSVNFKAFITLAFKTDSKVKIQFGAREDGKGKWKIIQGNLAGDVFTLKTKEFGHYTVVTNKGQSNKKVKK